MVVIHRVVPPVDARSLNLSGNKLTGPLPTLLTSLSHLEVLSLSYNAFSGTAPVWLGSMTPLRLLDLSANALTGTLPATLALLMPVQGGNVEPVEVGGGLLLEDNCFTMPPPAPLATACAANQTDTQTYCVFVPQGSAC